MSNLYERYFIYSRTQMDRINAANNKAGRKNPTYGTVVVNGIPKTYTDRVSSMTNIPYADSVILIQGDIRKIHFTEPDF